MPSPGREYSQTITVWYCISCVVVQAGSYCFHCAICYCHCDIACRCANTRSARLTPEYNGVSHALHLCKSRMFLFHVVFAVGPCVVRPVELNTLSVGPSFYLPIREDVGMADNCEFSLMQDRGLDEQHSGVVVQGRLKQYQAFWRDTLGASEFVLGIVRDGYVLPLLADPPPVCFRNHRSALLHGDFVQKELSNLLKGNCIVPCAECPHVCNPLLVVTNASGKKRLVIDLRYLNQFWQLQKFKYESLAFLLNC